MFPIHTTASSHSTLLQCHVNLPSLWYTSHNVSEDAPTVHTNSHAKPVSQNQDSSVSRPRARAGQSNRGLITGRAKASRSALGPTSLLFSEDRKLCPGLNGHDVKLIIHLHPMPRLILGAVPSLLIPLTSATFTNSSR